MRRSRWESYQAVVGVDGGYTTISWSSVAEMRALAEQHGVGEQLWPVYEDSDIEAQVPLEDAERRSAELRAALERVDPRVVEGDYWLGLIWRLLRDGNAFFVMV